MYTILYNIMLCLNPLTPCCAINLNSKTVLLLINYVLNLNFQHR